MDEVKSCLLQLNHKDQFEKSLKLEAMTVPRPSLEDHANKTRLGGYHFFDDPFHEWWCRSENKAQKAL